MKLGVSHQRPSFLTPEYYNYLHQVGVEAMEVRVKREASSLEELRTIQRAVTDAGFELHEIMVNDRYNCERIATAQPEAEDDLAFFEAFLEDLGRLGIGATTYAWHTGGTSQTGRTMVRGCDSRHFRYDKTVDLPVVYERSYEESELWANYERFMERILPVAERTGVRLQLHPNDPPADMQGVPRIFKSTAAFRKAMELTSYSPYAGILFCVGTWAEMCGEDGTGEDVSGSLQEFVKRGVVHQVHLRNIDRPLPEFAETLPDAGYLDLAGIVRMLATEEFDGMVVPDHIPVPVASPADQRTMEAFSLGYIRGIMQAASGVTSPP